MDSFDGYILASEYAKLCNISVEVVNNLCEKGLLESKQIEGQWAISKKHIPGEQTNTGTADVKIEAKNVEIGEIVGVKNVYNDIRKPGLEIYLRKVVEENGDININLVDANSTIKSIESCELFVPLDAFRIDSNDTHQGASEVRHPVIATIYSYISGKQRKTSRLFVLGSYGSGKTTLIRHIAACLASEELKKILKPNEAVLPRIGIQDLEGWVEDVTYIPMIINLDNYASFSYGEEQQKGVKELSIKNYIKRYVLRDIDFEFEDHLISGNALVFFDGYDSVVDSEKKRIKDEILAFISKYQKSKYIVTSREYAVSLSEWSSENFTHLSLATFTDEQIKTYIQKWSAICSVLEIFNDVGENEPTEYFDDIMQLMYFQNFTRKPIFLTYLASLRVRLGRNLGNNRGVVYEGLLRLAINQWEINKQKIYTTDSINSLRFPLASGIIDIDDFLSMLSSEAYNALLSEPQRMNIPISEIDEKSHSKISPFVLAQKFNHLARNKFNPLDIIADLDQRVGLLSSGTEEATKYYLFFSNFSIQLYLAGRHLSKNNDAGAFPSLLLRLLEKDFSKWREVYKFAVDYLCASDKGIIEAGRLIRRTADRIAEMDRDEEGYSDFLLLLASSVTDNFSHLMNNKNLLDEDDVTRIQRLATYLVDLVVRSQTSKNDRVTAGKYLGVLGDPRHGVNTDKNNNPVINWVTIPEGSFFLGSLDSDFNSRIQEKPSTVMSLPEFQISKYLITNAQFAAFVEDHGYDNFEYWDEQGLNWLKSNGQKGPINHLTYEMKLGNYPRVNISWYEATAFCNWLTKLLKLVDKTIRLPREVEWEKAARGNQRRNIYPWGDVFTSEKILANTVEAGINHTTAVGVFPEGDSYFGCSDMAGNTFEWCLDSWIETYSSSKPENKLIKTVRGGAYNFNFHHARTAARAKYKADWYSTYCGFRICMVSKT